MSAGSYSETLKDQTKKVNGGFQRGADLPQGNW